MAQRKRSKKVSPGARGKPMKSGVRSPTAHRTLEQGRAQGEPGGGTATPAKKKYRRDLGKLPKAGPGKDNAHKKAASKGGKTTKANTRPQSRSKNRGHGMTRGKKPNSNK